MDSFEKKLSKATSIDSREILGAISMVVDRQGTPLYHYASGYQSLAPDDPSILHNSAFVMASAGKFITHIAALQCVEHGLISLDEPVHPYLPELEHIHVLSKNQELNAVARSFDYRPASRKITLRHLLSHTSGVGHKSNPMIQEWRAAKGEAPKADYHPKAKAGIMERVSNGLVSLS
ncbi:beta-lactamase/transpeptidase-like protein [Mollisia scopiformis]|uniref:Beta-lactamase/transpeptidase-like protein n=1 Tax=Mollisia scopiformis TaxID=149040 RepID=A0A132BCC7_MOLSC|nr:beta-lactamase/transpeptidase-like protein [Mollisia scopiformis]KUJ10065.1 beta-lactamase/transpeptidase-like protein [Mollisia scopiformis]